MSRRRTLYVIAANTALLLCLVQATAYACIVAFDDWLWRLAVPAMSEAARRNYAHMSPADFATLMDAFDRVRFRYEPVVGFQTAPITSPLVNVDAHGIRANHPAPRAVEALDGAIWFFGGSTTFGEGIADHETIPAQLERRIGRPVINFGVSSYAALEENLLLSQYLRLGYRPALVLFLDGINESCDWAFTQEMRTFVDRGQPGFTWDVGGPVVYAARRVLNTARNMMGAVGEAPTLTCQVNGRPFALSTLHARLLAERDALCRLYRTECRTLVQPFAGVHGKHVELDRFFQQVHGAFLRALFEHLTPSWRSAGATFVTDALDTLDHHAFVDAVHYSAEASGMIARVIAERSSLAPASTR